jgi:nuclear protein localization family protein 4
MVFVTLPEQHAMETNNTATEVEPQNVKEDEIDVILSKESGTIERQRDAQLCHHGPQGKCVHCLPIDPFDADYLKSRDPPIKYLSFHAYLRKLQSGVDKYVVTLYYNYCNLAADCLSVLMTEESMLFWRVYLPQER